MGPAWGPCGCSGLSLYSVGRQWQGCSCEDGQKGSPCPQYCSPAGLGPPSFRPPASRPRRLAQEAPPGSRKATVSAGLLLEGEAKLTGISLCAPRSAGRSGLGLQAASANRLPEREAGD